MMKRALRVVVILGAGLLLASSVAQTDTTSGTPAAPSQAGQPVQPGTPSVTTPQQPSTPQRPSTPQWSDEETAIRVLLSAYDGFPTQVELVEVSKDAPSILIAIAQDESALPTMRNRAIDALGYFDSEEVASYLGAVLKDGGELETHHAITALMKTQGEKGLTVVGPFLAHADAQTRITAIIAVGTYGGRGGKALLEKRSKVEKSDFVQSMIQKHL